MDPATFFDERLAAILTEDPLPFEWRGRCLFDVRGDRPGAWTVDLRDGARTCSPGRDGTYDGVVEVSSDDLERLLQNPLLVPELVLFGRLRLTGDASLARFFGFVLERAVPGGDAGRGGLQPFDAAWVADEPTRRAAAQLARDGWVQLEDTIDPALLSELEPAFGQILRREQRRQQPNRGTERWTLPLPFEAPFSHPALCDNEAVLRVLAEVFPRAPLPKCLYLSSDTPLTGSLAQHPHSDVDPLFPVEELHALPCFAVVVNVPLVDCTVENGAMELWPGTHLRHGLRDRVGCPGCWMCEEAARTPSIRFTAPRGSILLRDVRTWHRGTVNHTAAPRPMLSLLYARHWWNPLPATLDPITIAQPTWERLSSRAKLLFRNAVIAPSAG